jgi:peptide subunit release factor 1 (eRF1)
MTKDDIKELAGINSKHGLCVSMFLNIDKTSQDKHEISSRINHLLNEEEKNLSAGHDAAKHLRADYAAIWKFAENGLVTKNKRGLAIFSNSEMNYFKAIYFTRPVEDRILFSTRFLVRPLIRYLDDNAKILAVFIDQSRGRLVEVDQGEVTRFIEFEDEVPKKVKAGTHYGLADKRIERHVKWHIRGHLKKLTEMTLDLLKKDGYQWLFVYGLGEELSDYVKILHSYPKRKLVFEEQVDMLDEAERF